MRMIVIRITTLSGVIDIYLLNYLLIFITFSHFCSRYFLSLEDSILISYYITFIREIMNTGEKI